LCLQDDQDFIKKHLQQNLPKNSTNIQTPTHISS
jgi:hypothetical protein